MESRISARSDVAVAATTPRVTPTPPRTRFGEVLSRSLVRSAETAMRVLPGAPLMAVAVRGAHGPVPPLGVPMTGAGALRTASPEGPGGLGSPAAVTAGVPGAGVGLGATGAAGEASGLEASLAQSQEMNLYYLQVQESVNAQNRSFTALSNVLKAEHDTVKTAIGNIR